MATGSPAWLWRAVTGAAAPRLTTCFGRPEHHRGRVKFLPPAGLRVPKAAAGGPRKAARPSTTRPTPIPLEQSLVCRNFCTATTPSLHSPPRPSTKGHRPPAAASGALNAQERGQPAGAAPSLPKPLGRGKPTSFRLHRPPALRHPQIDRDYTITLLPWPTCVPDHAQKTTSPCFGFR
jgi:hypothetical protein